MMKTMLLTFAFVSCALATPALGFFLGGPGQTFYDSQSQTIVEPDQPTGELRWLTRDCRGQLLALVQMENQTAAIFELGYSNYAWPPNPAFTIDSTVYDARSMIVTKGCDILVADAGAVTRDDAGNIVAQNPGSITFIDKDYGFSETIETMAPPASYGPVALARRCDNHILIGYGAIGELDTSSTRSTITDAGEFSSTEEFKDLNPGAFVFPPATRSPSITGMVVTTACDVYAGSHDWWWTPANGLIQDAFPYFHDFIAVDVNGDVLVWTGTVLANFGRIPSGSPISTPSRPPVDFVVTGLYGDFPRGDINPNHCVDRDDLDLILRDIRGPAPHNPAFDLNGDGEVNIADARWLVTRFTNPRGAPCQ